MNVIAQHEDAKCIRADHHDGDAAEDQTRKDTDGVDCTFNFDYDSLQGKNSARLRYSPATSAVVIGRRSTNRAYKIECFQGDSAIISFHIFAVIYII